MTAAGRIAFALFRLLVTLVVCLALAAGVAVVAALLMVACSAHAG